MLLICVFLISAFTNFLRLNWLKTFECWFTILSLHITRKEFLWILSGLLKETAITWIGSSRWSTKSSTAIDSTKVSIFDFFIFYFEFYTFTWFNPKLSTLRHWFTRSLYQALKNDSKLKKVFYLQQIKLKSVQFIKNQNIDSIIKNLCLLIK